CGNAARHSALPTSGTRAARNTSEAAPPSTVRPQPTTVAIVPGRYESASPAATSSAGSYGTAEASVSTARSSPVDGVSNCGGTHMSRPPTRVPSVEFLSVRPATTSIRSGGNATTQCAAASTESWSISTPPQNCFPSSVVRYTA